MKNLRQIISVVLFALLVTSAVFNILYMFGIVSRELTRAGFFIFLAVLFIVSLLGLILKDMRKEDTVSLNIVTPVKEIGAAYIWALIIWVISNGVILVFNWQQFGW